VTEERTDLYRMFAEITTRLWQRNELLCVESCWYHDTYVTVEWLHASLHVARLSLRLNTLRIQMWQSASGASWGVCARRFKTVFSKVRLLTIAWASWAQPTLPHLVCLCSDLHVRLSVTSSLFSLGLRTEILFAFLSYSVSRPLNPHRLAAYKIVF
jgi:hypothetical protein